jgi:cardiolipin synthase C
MSQRLLAFFLAGFLGLGGCATLDVPRVASEALPATQSAFGRSIQAQAAPYQGRSGFACCPTAAKRSWLAPS